MGTPSRHRAYTKTRGVRRARPLARRESGDCRRGVYRYWDRWLGPQFVVVGCSGVRIRAEREPTEGSYMTKSPEWASASLSCRDQVEGSETERAGAARQATRCLLLVSAGDGDRVHENITESDSGCTR